MQAVRALEKAPPAEIKTQHPIPTTTNDQPKQRGISSLFAPKAESQQSPTDTIQTIKALLKSIKLFSGPRMEQKLNELNCILKANPNFKVAFFMVRPFAKDH